MHYRYVLDMDYTMIICDKSHILLWLSYVPLQWVKHIVAALTRSKVITLVNVAFTLSILVHRINWYRHKAAYTVSFYINYCITILWQHMIQWTVQSCIVNCNASASFFIMDTEWVQHWNGILAVTSSVSPIIKLELHQSCCICHFGIIVYSLICKHLPS